MSFNLWARPAPKRKPAASSFYAIKFAMAKRYLTGDGSLRTEAFLLTRADAAWLEGIRAAGAGDISDEADALLKLLSANPQGLFVWIGEEDDDGCMS